MSTYPDLFAELLSRGWTRSDLEKLAFHNFYRVLKAAEQVIKLTVTTDSPGASPVSQFGLAVRRTWVQTHKRFKIMLFIRTKHNMRIFGITLFIKLQNDT